MSNKRANQSDISLNIRRFWTHLRDFPYIWILLFALMISAIIAFFCPQKWGLAEILGGIALFLMTLLLLVKPMNAVYGLIGASGSIPLFFGNFILITVVFAGIYQLEFFQNAGITYDVNQPHIDYRMFSGTNKSDSTRVLEKKQTVYLEHYTDSTIVCESVIQSFTEELKYQRIGFLEVWKSTIFTTLTQEPTDLFNIASTYNSSMEDGPDECIDRQKSQLFHWILIFHTIISWIFFGVFISLLYNKFRYES